MPLLSEAELAALKAIDTPTICNAIETFGVRSRVEGFMGMDIRCLLPGQGVMLGYAITVFVDSTTPDLERNPRGWQAWMKAMEASSKPSVIVLKDIGPQPRRSAHFGEVMGTLARRLGAAGVVSDGGLRDILELEALGLQCFAPGLVPSHGNPRLIEVNQPVEIDSVVICPGDLLHGDANGLTRIPLEIAPGIPAAADRLREAEADLMSYINGPDFSVDGLYQRKFTH